MKSAKKNNQILFFNPRSAERNYRLPLSLLHVSASVDGQYEFVFVDGNLERDPWTKIGSYLDSGNFRYFACTVMPGPQLKQAIPYSKLVKTFYPGVITIWGGYFASNHYQTVIQSGYVDFVIYGPGDFAFPKLLDFLENGWFDRLNEIPNLVYRDHSREIVITAFRNIPGPDEGHALPIGKLRKFYDIEHYIARTFIGERTILYNSSLGCPYNCAFCGVASVYHSSWQGKPASVMFRDIMTYRDQFRIDALEIIDSNFFSSHGRVIEFCRLMKGQNINWWAECRIDSLNNFSDDELFLLGESGCKLVFMGAESGDDKILQQVNKGGKITAAMTKELTIRLKKAGIIPEFSFVLGLPPAVNSDAFPGIKKEISFIRSLKKINKQTKIILYIYSPVPSNNTLLKDGIRKWGFTFPETLDGWLNPEWEQADLRKNPGTPWLSNRSIRYIHNFETVLTCAFPGVSNFRIKGMKKLFLVLPGKLRYRFRWYSFPAELKILLGLMGYQRPEKEGFYRE